MQSKITSRYEKAMIHKYLGGTTCICGKPKWRLKVFCPDCWEVAHSLTEWDEFVSACDIYCSAFKKLREKAEEVCDATS